jgi:CubicO group peptidase (beta-lactamase class C family)
MFRPAILAVMFTAACQGQKPVVPITEPDLAYFPAATWRAGDAAATGFDPGRLSALRGDVTAGRYGAINSVLVIRYGWLVHEHYKGKTPAQTHSLQSVSKSVTSLIFGIAAQGRAGAWVDRPVVEVFARYPAIASLDDAKRALTIRHLLTMRTGMDFWEQPYAGSPLETLNNSSGDWTKYILDRPMTAGPGSRWAYNSGAAILMCAVVRELTGEPVQDFARRELFAPIGIGSDSWFTSPFDRLPHCGGGLNLTPSDLARLGYLVLRNGKWGDRQVVSADWLRESTQPYSSGSDLIFSYFGAKYGYFWWLFPIRRGGTDSGIIAASGSGGQWLFVVPSLDLVVVVTASNGAGLDLMYDGVLAAIR